MIKTFFYYLKIYFIIVSQDFKSKMQYRADFYISSFGMIFTNIAGIVTFEILFNNIKLLEGWNYYEILFMYGFSLITLTPVQLFFDNLWNLNSSVYSGDFIKYCFRPLNRFFYYFSEVFDIKGIGQLIVGIVVLTYSINNLNISFSLLTLIMLIISIIGGSLVMIGILVLSSSTAFWIIQSQPIVMFANNLKDYAKYPITIFNPVLKFVFSFLIPIAFISYYPSLIFLNSKSDYSLAFLSPLVGLVIFEISYLIWMRGASRYSGTGS